VDWQSSTRGLSRIWEQVIEESRFFWGTPLYSGDMLEAMVWQFLLFCPSKYGDFPPFLLKIPLLHSQPFFFGHQVVRFCQKKKMQHRTLTFLLETVGISPKDRCSRLSGGTCINPKLLQPLPLNSLAKMMLQKKML